ncbi:MAG: hypothetical protein ACE14O_02835 [Candidatus Cloacimonadaceae bacterium]
MKGKLFYVVLAFAVYIFFYCFNSNQILHSTQKCASLEKAFQAERSINNELKIEHDKLVSERNISSLLASDKSNYISKDKAKNIIYVQEKKEQEASEFYSIIDLFTPKAEAATTFLPD